MIKVGESTGNISESLENVSYFFNREVQESVDRVQTMIQPVLTLIIGLLVATLAVSVLGPIYDVISKAV